MHPFYKKASLPCGISRTVVSGKLVCILASVASNGGLRNTRLLDMVLRPKWTGGGAHFVFSWVLLHCSFSTRTPRTKLQLHFLVPTTIVSRGKPNPTIIVTLSVRNTTSVVGPADGVREVMSKWGVGAAQTEQHRLMSKQLSETLIAALGSCCRRFTLHYSRFIPITII